MLRKRHVIKVDPLCYLRSDSTEFHGTAQGSSDCLIDMMKLVKRETLLGIWRLRCVEKRRQ